MGLVLLQHGGNFLAHPVVDSRGDLAQVARCAMVLDHGEQLRGERVRHGAVQLGCAAGLVPYDAYRVGAGFCDLR